MDAAGWAGTECRIRPVLIDRRVHLRAVVRLRGRLLAAGSPTWIDVLVHDLSSGGAGILTPSLPEIGSEVALEFTLPGAEGEEDHDVAVPCLVVRTGRPAQSDPLRPHLVGVHFLALDAESGERVRAYVWGRLQKPEG